MKKWFLSFIIFACVLLLLALSGQYLATTLNNPLESCDIATCTIHHSVGGDTVVDSPQLGTILEVSKWPPRWQCGNWDPWFAWLYILSDFLTFLAYFGIPIVILFYLVYRKPTQLPFSNLLWLFSFFIFFCGITHLIDGIIFWIPLYNLNAVFKSFTAAISITTLIVLVYKVPSLFKLKSPWQLEAIIEEKTSELQNTNATLTLEIALRAKAEEDLRRSLEANEKLFTEMHHRVKNNLQLIHSMIYINQNKLKEEDQPYLDAIGTRIKNMSKVHEILLMSKQETTISMAEYIKRLTNYLSETYISKEASITVTTAIDPALIIDNQQAVNLGLIINELFTNSVKYAFNASGEIFIKAKKGDGQFSLIFGDTGRGIDKDKSQSPESTGFGSNLVQIFVNNLKGKYTVDSSDNGTIYEFTFDDFNYFR